MLSARARSRSVAASREAGSGGTDQELTPVDARGLEAAADWGSLRSAENYLGYQRTENFASSNGAVLDTPQVYAVPERLRLNHWALSGDWTVGRQAIVLNQAGGRIAYRFHARDLHLVMAPPAPEASIRFRVQIDGEPPGAAHGTDVDDQGNEDHEVLKRDFQNVARTSPDKAAEIIVRGVEKGPNEKSIADILVDAGCNLGPSGCAACLGGPADTFGRLNGMEVCISTTNRNFPGRMGSTKSAVYLASPLTVAASALTGKITDPRDFVSQPIENGLRMRIEAEEGRAVAVP